jgi:pyruvate formate lyase activating enzyme
MVTVDRKCSVHDALLGTVEGDKIRCNLCPHLCLSAEGARGFCGARGVVDHKLRLLTYGVVSSVALDPIEKKPVFHFCPGSKVMSFGSVGCTMRCGHCQNWQISRPRGVDGTVPVREISAEEAVRISVDAHADGIAFTYNEPVIELEWVLDVGRLAKQAGLFNVMVTNGYVTAEGLDLFAEVTDVWRVDIKGFAEEPFRRLCKVRHPEIVREQAVRARRVHGMHVECVTNVVPTINDSDEELRNIAHWIATELGPDTPWHVTRFIPYLEFADLPPTPLETLDRARQIGAEAGLPYVYLGNVPAKGGEDTKCPACGALAVRREGFSADPGAMSEHHCGQCGNYLPISAYACR